MSKEMVISANPHETRVAILEEGQLCEFYVEREKEFALVGSLYKGRVTRVLPGMQSAFVDIGLDSDAFLYVSDFLEHLEDYDHVAAPVETKFQKMPQPGSEVFAPSTINGGVTHEPAVEVAPPVAPITDAGSTFTQTAFSDQWNPQEQTGADSTFTPNASSEAESQPEKGDAAQPAAAEAAPPAVPNTGAPPAPPVAHPAALRAKTRPRTRRLQQPWWTRRRQSQVGSPRRRARPAAEPRFAAIKICFAKAV